MNDIFNNTSSETLMLLRCLLAFVLGLLIGLQRESVAARKSELNHPSAGIRTFPILCILGFCSSYIATLAESHWPISITIFSVAGIFALNHYIKAIKGDLGLTTAVSAILTAIIGVLCFYGKLNIAIAVTLISTMLLSLKIEMHEFAHNILRKDFIAILKLAIISVLILPHLPNQNFGIAPFDIFNPFKIWMLIVFISAISFVGYVLVKLRGPKQGIALTGYLGGFASSTALTLCFSERSNSSSGKIVHQMAFAIISAWTIMFIKVYFIVGALNIKLLSPLIIPLAIPTVIGFAYSYYMLKKLPVDNDEDDVTFDQPFELSGAIKFGVIFTVVLFISRVTQIYFGDIGMYISSFLSGLADVDAVAISMSQLSSSATDTLNAQIATVAIAIGAASNTFSKGMIVLLTGSRELKRYILKGYILIIGSAFAAIFLI